MHWRRHIYRFEVLKLHGSEVMMSTKFGVKVVSVQVAHVGAQNGHLFERPLGTTLYYHGIILRVYI